MRATAIRGQSDHDIEVGQRSLGDLAVVENRRIAKPLDAYLVQLNASCVKLILDVRQHGPLTRLGRCNPTYRSRGPAPQPCSATRCEDGPRSSARVSHWLDSRVRQ